jgi:hypothetical protein
LGEVFGFVDEGRPSLYANRLLRDLPFPAGWETDAAGREYYEARAALMIEHHEGLDQDL